MVDLASTIVARGCAPGRGTRAIVRLSGEGCRAIRAGLGCELPFARGARASRLRLPSGTLPCIEYVAPGPASYTGEDTLELVVVGNDDLVSEIEATALRVAAERGVTARPAAPGEFTLRAFARGRIDLTQAEGIAATIAATTDAHLRAARQLAEGGLGRFVHATADRLANDLALVEAGIDFTDQEDVVAIEPAELERHLRAAADSIRTRLARSVPWERFESTPRVVLVGAPNAGKSTLFNALIGRRRAVESATAGTTRDVIEETVAFTTRRGRCEIRLVDAAGADASATGLNPAMQTRLREAIDRADLVVECVAAPSVGCADISPARGGGEREGILAAGVAASTARDRSPSAPPGEMSAQPTEGARAARLRITTKADLHASADGLAVSAHTGHGLDRLREAIAAALGARLAALSDETLVLAERHESAMRAALAALDECVDLVASERLRSPELVAASLRSALDSLGTISGAIAPDDVLGRIFGSFCVGK